MAVLPPLPADKSASAPCMRSDFVRPPHTLAICGHANAFDTDASSSTMPGPITTLRPLVPNRYGPALATKPARLVKAPGLNHWFGVGLSSLGLMPVASARQVESVF